MRFIELTDETGYLGKFDVPDYVRGSGVIYRLFGAVRPGGNGVVFDAHHMEGIGKPGLPFAVKLLKQLSPARMDRFQNEIRVMKEVDSEHVVKYFAHGSVQVDNQLNPHDKRSVPWLAMQLGGRNMREQVDSHGPISLGKLKALVPGLCGSLTALHNAGFIHRDIKPENFVWRNEGQNDLLMIDLGIAKRTGEDVSARPMDSFTQVKEFVGPVFFSSPELIAYAKDKSQQVDFRSDIFQVGKLIWFLATGKITAGVPSKRDCPANGKLRDLVAAMIDDDPDSRPQSVEEVRRLAGEI